MLTEDKVIGIYCLIDDMLKSIHHPEDSRRRISDSEVLFTAIISALYFGGHQVNALGYVKQTGLVPYMLDKSRFSRRLHQLEGLLFAMFHQVGHYLKEVSCERDYVIDSFPVPVCDNIRISNCKLLSGEQWRGYTASMRRYFYGVKVQLLTTKSGIPVEFCFVPGCEHDSKALEQMPFNLPPESNIYGDSAYTNYEIEDLMRETELISLHIQRKANSKRKDSKSAAFIKLSMRKQIESSISEIKALFLRTIHAVTLKGFLLKIVLFLFALQLRKIN